MGKKATKKFVASGQLKKTIEARHKSKQFKKKFQSRRGRKDTDGKQRPVEGEDEEEEVISKAPGRYVQVNF